MGLISDALKSGYTPSGQNVKPTQRKRRSNFGQQVASRRKRLRQDLCEIVNSQLGPNGRRVSVDEISHYASSLSGAGSFTVAVGYNDSEHYTLARQGKSRKGSIEQQCFTLYKNGQAIDSFELPLVTGQGNPISYSLVAHKMAPPTIPEPVVAEPVVARQLNPKSANDYSAQKPADSLERPRTLFGMPYDLWLKVSRRRN